MESLRGELASAQSSNREQKEQLARLQAQLDAYQLKNNVSMRLRHGGQYTGHKDRIIFFRVNKSYSREEN